MPSTGTAEEVHDEENDGYDYDDDFEVGCLSLWQSSVVILQISGEKYAHKLDYVSEKRSIKGKLLPCWMLE